MGFSECHKAYQDFIGQSLSRALQVGGFTKADLYNLAKKYNVKGRSQMSKTQLEKSIKKKLDK
jgi:hypothetical protein